MFAGPSGACMLVDADVEARRVVERRPEILAATAAQTFRRTGDRHLGRHPRPFAAGSPWIVFADPPARR